MKDFFKRPIVVMVLIGVVCLALVILISVVFPYLPGAQE
ncbi:ABC-type transporter Mla subunit MlaD [Alicyclobacillus cycloheptanicus]|uniref:ABC-type transporter Mla subunit MlaD n=1 Tax=Alicyclobacillus cycloheptanicus TaxID=1457 RepID=A0ABT9XE65_9BACL|nr:ABC-type transporter Mla subunit MlaD [Alicyclobacillus cycloheptanicus]